MNITSFNNVSIQRNSPAFCKKYIDTDVQIRNTNGTKSDGCFVEYERKSTRDMMQIETLAKLWKDKTPFIGAITENFKTSRGSMDGVHLYGLENTYGDTLALAKVLDSYDIDDGTKVTYISYVQSSPDEMYTAPSRHHKGLGETLVSKIVQEAKNAGADKIELTSVNEHFWESSKLFENKSSNRRDADKILPSKHFDDYIAYVDNKTKPRYLDACG